MRRGRRDRDVVARLAAHLTVLLLPVASAPVLLLASATSSRAELPVDRSEQSSPSLQPVRISLSDYLPVARSSWIERARGRKRPAIVGGLESFEQPSGSSVRFHFALPARAVLRGVARLVSGTGAFADSSAPALRVTVGDDQRAEYVLETATVAELSGPAGFVLKVDLGDRAGSFAALGFEFVRPGSRLEWRELRLEGVETWPRDPLALRRASYNLLVILFDTLRADHTEPYGAKGVRTPHISRLASRGVVFANASTSASWTTPSIASMFTSTYPWVHGIASFEEIRSGRRGLHADLPYLPEILAEKGYETLAVLNNPMVSPAFGFGRGFRRIERRYERSELARSREHDSPAAEADLVWSSFVAPLIERSRGRPFFAFLHEIDPHHPYDPPPPFDSMYDPDYDGEAERFLNLHAFKHNKTQQWPELVRGLEKLKKSPRWKEFSPQARETARRLLREADFPMEEADIRHVNALYDGEVTFMDGYLGRVLERLEASGVAGHTLVVFTSDHGEMLGEQHRFGHGSYVAEPVRRVPLILSLPEVLPQGRRPAVHAELLDLAPTVLDLLGITRPPSMQGRSLLPFVFAGDERAPGRATFSQASYDAEFASEAVNFGRWKLVRESSSNAGRQERARFRLFDLSEDPEERVDRSNELPVSTRTLRQMLAWRRYTDARARAAREEPGPVDLDPELLEQMRALGYVP